CSARKPAWPLSWMARSISLMLTGIAGTGGKTPCYSKMDISCCDSWRKTQASDSIKFWTQYWPLSVIVMLLQTEPKTKSAIEVCQIKLIQSADLASDKAARC